MINRSFHGFRARFDASQFGAAFAPRKPRHPLARLAVGLLVVGVVVGTAMLAVGLLRRLLSRGARPQPRPGNVVDAEYRVVDKPVHTLTY